MKKIVLLFLSLISYAAHAQTQEQKDSIKNITLNTVIISGNKFAEKQKNIVQKTDVITQDELKKTNAQSTADVLLNTGNVFVQKSQQGGGSPVIRGFEASRIQLNIDGIKHNNAIFRAGHLQNIISIDNNALDRIEVMNGPASTIHGSDALGGVIVLKTREPKMAKGKEFKITAANALTRYSSANNEKTASAGINFGNNRFSSLTQVTYSDFDDLVQGKNGHDSIVNLWKKKYVIERYNNKDSAVKNENPYKQVSTGYSQFDLLQKFKIVQSQYVKHSINLQMSNSTNVPRYDRLTEVNASGVPKSAEWYYGPQFRTLEAYSIDVNGLHSFFNDITANINHQYLEESRHNRNFGSKNLNHRYEKIHVGGYNFAIRHRDDINELTLGTDGQFNFLKSTANREDITTGNKTPLDTRYPDGDNQMHLLGLFYQHILKAEEGKLVFNDGLRYNYTNLHCTLRDTSIQFKLPFSVLEQRNHAVTGNAGVAYMPVDELRLSANISSGFRSPNIDDMAKVFESVSGQRLIVPNVNLKPEYTRNGEVGISYNNGTIEINANGYYTLFNNAIVTDRFTYNGQDSVLYNGTITPVYASQNKAKAYIYGGGIACLYRPVLHFTISGNLNYTYGRYDQDTTTVPLDHIPPVTGRISMRYDNKIWYTELYSLFNGRKKLIDYNMGGEDNLNYATPNGMPSWYTINIRAGVTLAKYMQIQAGVENILDKNYRYFASGMSAPGRNFVLAMRFNY